MIIKTVTIAYEGRESMMENTMRCIKCKTEIVFHDRRRFFNWFGRVCPVCGGAVLPTPPPCKGKHGRPGGPNAPHADN